jgi:hypothetical protein
MEALRTARRTVPFLLGVIVLSACGGGGGGGGSGSNSGPPPSQPTISALTVTPSTTTQGSGTIAVNGTIKFTDSGGDLASLTVVVLGASGKQASSTTTPLQGVSGQTSGTITGTAQVSTRTPGLFTFQVSVTDVGGLKSNVLNGNLQVVPLASLAAVVTTTGPNPQSLKTINGTLYWSESGEDALKSAPVTGGTATVLATKMVNPAGLDFSGTDVIWLDDRFPTLYYYDCGAVNSNRALKRSPLDNPGLTTVLATGPACSGGASDVVAFGTSAFWVSSTSNPNTWVLNAASLNGGTATTLRTTTTAIVALRLNGGRLYWMESSFPATKATIFSTVPGSGTTTAVASGFSCDSNTFAVDNNAVYYATPNSPATTPPTETLWAQPLAGGAPRTLSSSISAPIKILSTANISGNSVVWVDSTDVSSVPTGGGTVTQLATVSGEPVDVLFDGANVVWSEVTTNSGQPGESGRIVSVPLGAGTVTVLHQGGDAPRQLGRDANARLTWTEGGLVGEQAGFARIARIGLSGAEQTVVAGVNSDSAKLAAAPAALLIAEPGLIKSLPRTGGTLSTVVALPNGTYVSDLTTDGTSVYWTDGASHVSKAPVAGGPITVFVNCFTPGVSCHSFGTIRIAPDGTIFWADQLSLEPEPWGILSFASTTSSAKLVAPQLVGLTDFVVDTSQVYIATSDPLGPITTVSVTGGSPRTLTWTNAPVAQLTLDGSILYWLGGGIFKIPTAGAGSSTRVIEVDTGTPTSFAVDSTDVYYTDAQLLDIRKIAK